MLPETVPFARAQTKEGQMRNAVVPLDTESETTNAATASLRLVEPPPTAVDLARPGGRVETLDNIWLPRQNPLSVGAV